MSKLTRASLAAVGAGVVTLATVFAVPAFALPGDDPVCPENPGKTCTQTPPAVLKLCPPGYTPSTDQPQPVIGTLCVAVGQDKHGDLHALARVAPILCAHVKVGNNDKPGDLVRTLKCPVYKYPKPETPPVGDNTTPPASGGDDVVPVAPAPVIVPNHLPVTH